MSEGEQQEQVRRNGGGGGGRRGGGAPAPAATAQPQAAVTPVPSAIPPASEPAPAFPAAPQDLRTRLRAGILAFLNRHQETQVTTLLDALRQQLPRFDRMEETAALEVLHELITANVIMPGVDRGHLGG